MQTQERAGFGWDYVVRDASGRPVITVEVKNYREADTAWAQAFSLKFAPGLPGSSLLLVAPSNMFWWPAGARIGSPPSRESSTSTVLEKHLKGMPRVDSVVLEAAVGFWLQDIVDGVVPPSEILKDIDAESLRGGSVVRVS